MSSATAMLRIVALGEFGGRNETKGARLPVDKDRFDEVFARISPRLEFDVANRIGGATPQLEIALAPAGLRELSPPGVVEAVPALVSLRALRRAVEAAGRGELGVDALRERAREWAPAPLAEALVGLVAGTSAAHPAAPAPSGSAAPPAGDVDAILGLVRTSGASPSGPQETARRLVDALTTRPSAGPALQARSGAGAAAAALDEVLSAQLDEILHAPAFSNLESLWRGAKLLVDRTDFRQAIALELACAGMDAAPEAIDRLAEDEDADLVLAAFELGAGAQDLARAQALASAGERAQTPVAVGVTPGFLGLTSWLALAKARLPQQTFEEPAYVGWRSLRQRDEARWLVLLANRIAVRMPYGAGGEAPRGMDYTENGTFPGLLGSPVWALGSVVTRCFARTGTCLQISGSHHALVTDLPLLRSSEEAKPSPVEGIFGNERREDLEKIGVSAVQLYQRDVAFFGSVRSFRRPERYPDADATADAAQQCTLAYQLFASRLTKFLGRTLPELGATGGVAQATETLRNATIGFLSTPQAPLAPERVGVVMKPNPKDPTLTDVALRAGPDLTLAGRPVNVLLNFSLRL
jgi:predicted component of type VI protein secretion system